MELSREQIRSIIYYEWIDVKDAREIYGRITRRLGDAAVSEYAVKYWIHQFNFGRRSLEDEPRSGRPSTSTTDENVEIVRRLVEANRRITYDELEHRTKIGRGRLEIILKEKLGAQKKMSQFVPH